ncbi:histidine phosphatase family protein [Paenibacillus sp. KN14-4R]|uniref:histidine phosphatase family protein n=1 Tax=Paenibacillus sp. KN14-4R TaxID=3445773 RepID=UPI003FA12C8C
MKNIYLVRHCKASGQAADAPLTEIGIAQAKQLVHFFSDKNIDSIISSPFERAHQTIHPLSAQLGIEITLDDRLMERVLIGEDHPDWYEMLRQTFDDLDLCYEGGESSRTAMARAISVVDEILSSRAQNTVIVSHGNLISLLLKHFDKRMGFKEWEALSNPDVYHLSFDNHSPSVKRIWTESSL